LAKMPVGLRMIRGDPHRQTRLPKPDEISRDVENLFWYDTDNGGFPSFLDREWQVRIMFPNCWDGVNLVTSDLSQNTHVAFRDDASGLCLETHPVRIPQLFIEAVYQVDAVTREHPEVQRNDYLFSTGDKDGWGAHADYISGWQQEVLDAALETCDNNDWSNPRCAFHQFVDVRSKDPHGYYKGQPKEAVDDIEQLLVSGEECHMSGFPPAAFALAQPSPMPAALQNKFGVFGTC